MTSAHDARQTTRSTADDSRTLRLRLKQRTPATGFVDGGWWPWTRDLPTEVAALRLALAARVGPVESVSYNLADWGPAPRKVTIDGSQVRLAGYRSQHPDTVDVFGVRERVTLLVVPPEATAQAAHRSLMAAGGRANTDSIEALLDAPDGYEAEDGVAEQARPSTAARPGRIPGASGGELGPAAPTVGPHDQPQHLEGNRPWPAAGLTSRSTTSASDSSPTPS